MSAAAASRPGAPDVARPRPSFSPWQAACDRVLLWKRRRQERSELARLSDRELYDFGASRSDAMAELRKPFWRG
jgi:uncharacterized protein YjiS (DUF1127 family)